MRSARWPPRVRDQRLPLTAVSSRERGSTARAAASRSDAAAADAAATARPTSSSAEPYASRTSAGDAWVVNAGGGGRAGTAVGSAADNPARE